jgi:hypothetical protein
MAPRLTRCRVVHGSRWQRLSDHNPVFAEISGLEDAVPDFGVRLDPALPVERV